MSRRWILTFALVVALATFAAQMVAQSLISGDLSGTVTDPSGAVVPNAPVTLKSLDTGETRTGNTNANGAYRFTLLKPGRYSVAVAQTGFQKVERPVTVAVGQVATADLALQVGQATQTVEVTAAAPVINPEPSQSTSFSEQVVQNLPNPGGDLTNIAQLAPGATMNTSNGYGNLTVNGLPATSNLFTINGENDMDPFFNINNSGATNLTLGQNEIQEATVVTNAYAGQYGQQAGAQVNYVTKSGTNSFHGSAKYLWNGRTMNANDWFNKFVCDSSVNPNCLSAPTDRPFANNNQWGADFGGPLIKDKTFFYVNTEGLRYVLPTVQSTFVPSPQFMDASQAFIAATDPAGVANYQKLYSAYRTALAAHPGAAPSDTCDGQSVSIPGLTGATPCVFHFSATPTAHSNEFILSGRVDQNLGNSDKAYARFRMDRGTQATITDPISPTFNATSSQPAYDGQLQETHVFSGNTTNQFLGAVSYYSAIFLQGPEAGQTLPVGPVFLNGLTTFNQIWRFPQGRNITQYQVGDDFTHIHGSHSLKFGANFRRYDVSDWNFSRINPEVIFADMQSLATDTGVFRWDQRFSNIGVKVPIAYYGLGLYAQDEWKVSRNLKLTMALRAEHTSNAVCQTNCFTQVQTPYALLAPTVNTPYSAVITPGQHQAFVATDKINWSPRIGFTWGAFGSDKTVISGGVGIFYDAFPESLVDAAFLNAPNTYRAQVGGLGWADGTAAAAAAASAGALTSNFANGATFTSLRAALGTAFRGPTLTTYPTQMHTPQYQEWNLQVQQSIGGGAALTLNYFGTHGIHIPIANAWLNSFDPGACGGDAGVSCGIPGIPNSATAPNRSFGTVTEFATAAVSNSNGLSATFSKRMSHGVSFRANYTWSHTLDEVSNGGVNPYDFGGPGGFGSGSMLFQINPLCLRCNNYGNSDYDIRHNFTADFVWNTPALKTNKLLYNTIGGWTISGGIFARTGLPYTVWDSNVALGNGPATSSGNAVGMVPAQPLGPGAAFGQTGNCKDGSTLCFDPAAFVNSTSSTFAGFGTFPTQARNQYRGPNLFDTNMSVSKNFKMTERLVLGLGANFYNIFNHPNFYLPDNLLGDQAVGLPPSTVSTPASPYGSFAGAAAAPRLIQLQGRITF